MNWAQFKDPISHMCLAGAVVASWSLTREVASSSPFSVMTNIFVTEFAEFIENIQENLHCAKVEILGTNGVLFFKHVLLDLRYGTQPY